MSLLLEQLTSLMESGLLTPEEFEAKRVELLERNTPAPTDEEIASEANADAIIASPREAASDGSYEELDTMTGLKTCVSEFAGHNAAEAARQ